MAHVRTAKGRRRSAHTLSSDSIGLQLSGILRKRWSIFLAQLRRCKKQSTEPAIHDLRVATRRLIAALDLLTAIIPERQVGKARMQLRRLLKAMNPLRDTQVQLLAVRELLPKFPELEPYCTALLMRELRELGQISRRLAKVEPRSLGVQVREAARNLDRLLRRPETRDATDLAVRGAFASAFARVATRRSEVVRKDLGSIHRMRVSFKKFRYASEIVRPGMDRDFHKAMNAQQTKMGDIHDIEVLLAGIRSFVREYPIPGSLMRAQRHLLRQLTAKVSILMQSANGFRKFYTPTGMK